MIWELHPDERWREDVFREFFASHLASGGALVILDREDGQVIGTSRYHGYDAAKSEVEIGWTFLARSHWGGTMNGEVKRLMLEHAFGSVERVVFLAAVENLRSRRAIEKLGATFVEVTKRPGFDRASAVYEVRRPGANYARRVDWRLTRQEEFLAGAVLARRRYHARSASSEHEHCAFCWAKFMDPEFSPEHRRFVAENPDVLTEGYTTTHAHPDGEGVRWICEPCFNDFRERFGWRVTTG
jgi:N-acetyltransferase